jgi:hypothetical protein
LGASFGLYLFFNYRSRNLAFNPSPVDANKKYLISVIPSSINLLESILTSYPNLEKIYFIYDNFLTASKIKKRIKSQKLYSKAKFLKVKSTNEPNNIISSFDDIMQELDDVQKSDILIEVTSGQTLSSLTLYNLGKIYDINVSCLISKYDDDNKVIPNSAVANLVKFDLLGSK